MALGYTFLKLSFRAKSRNLLSFSLLGTRSLHAFHLVGMTCVGLGIAFLLSPLGSRFTNINIHDEAVTQRAVLVGASIKMVQSSPLLGVGLGNFLPTLAAIQKPLTASTYLQPVHNIFLLVAAETGLIGLSIFLWFLMKTLQKVRSQKFASRRSGSEVRSCLMVAFSVILITGFFDHYWLTLQQGQLLFAFILGMCWSRYQSTTVK